MLEEAHFPLRLKFVLISHCIIYDKKLWTKTKKITYLDFFLINYSETRICDITVHIKSA